MIIRYINERQSLKNKIIQYIKKSESKAELNKIKQKKKLKRKKQSREKQQEKAGQKHMEEHKNLLG